MPLLLPPCEMDVHSIRIHRYNHDTTACTTYMHVSLQCHVVQSAVNHQRPALLLPSNSAINHHVTIKLSTHSISQLDAESLTRMTVELRPSVISTAHFRARPFGFPFVSNPYLRAAGIPGRNNRAAVNYESSGIFGAQKGRRPQLAQDDPRNNRPWRHAWRIHVHMPIRAPAACP